MILAWSLGEIIKKQNKTTKKTQTNKQTNKQKNIKNAVPFKNVNKAVLKGFEMEDFSLVSRVDALRSKS